jgi:hypothetical protein
MAPHLTTAGIHMEKLMPVFVEILKFLQLTMERPTLYGLWHICSLILTVAACVCTVIFFRNASDKTMRRVLAVMWGIMVVFEMYKQIVYSFHVDGDMITFDFQWYAFPYQFCSTPLFALPFLIFMKDGPVRNFFTVFVTGFVLFAGVAVMIYPGDVFISMIGINIQTMVHHGLQVVMGVMLVAYNRRRMTLPNLGGSIAVFASFAAVAIILNEIAYAVFAANGIDETFNMFFISRHYPCTLPILSSIYPAVPYPVFLLIYLAGFALVAALFFGIEKGILWLTSRRKYAEK